mmetsp:Transcript_47907/g.124371  ORF Transcript_47907/g.124371 Transcript_47907/m.124371 type:complete len:895 (-) Transcript_47907:49-2733(-)
MERAGTSGIPVASKQHFEEKLVKLAAMARTVNDRLEKSFSDTLREIASMKKQLVSKGDSLLNATDDTASVVSKGSEGNLSRASSGRASARSAPPGSARSSASAPASGKGKRKSPKRAFGNLPIWERLNLEGLKARQKLAEKEEERMREEEAQTLPLAPTISKKSRAIANRNGRSQDVVSRLLADGERRRDHLDEMRMNAEQEEMATVRQPVINSRSRSAERLQPIGDRLFGVHERMMKKQAEMKQEADDELARKAPLVPQITRAARGLNRSAKNRQVWLEERERKRELAQKQKLEEEMMEVQNPKLSSGTQRLLQQKLNFKSPVKMMMTASVPSSRFGSMSSAESVNSTRDGQNGYMLRSALGGVSKGASSERAASEGKAKTRVNKRAQEAANRLYAHAMQVKEKKDQLLSERGYRHLVEERIGHKLYEPRINRTSRIIANSSKTPPPRLRQNSDNDDTASARMYRDAVDRKKRKEDLVKKYDEERIRQYPHLNKQSKMLASLLEIRTGVKAKERILQAKVKASLIRSGKGGSSESIVAEEGEGNGVDDKECTFKPTISHRSAYLAQKKLKEGVANNLMTAQNGVGNGGQRQAVLYDWMEKQKKKKEEMKQRVVHDEMKDCTFQPNSSRPSSAPHKRGGAGAGGGQLSRSRPTSAPRSNGDRERPRAFDGASFLRRNMEWLKQREQRNAEMRKKTEEKFSETYTFRPQQSSSRRGVGGGSVTSASSIPSSSNAMRSKLDRLLPSSARKEEILERLMATTKAAALKKKEKVPTWGNGAGRKHRPGSSNGSVSSLSESVAAMMGIGGDLLDPEGGAGQRGSVPVSRTSSRFSTGSRYSDADEVGNASDTGTDPGERRAEAAMEMDGQAWKVNDGDVERAASKHRTSSSWLQGVLQQ